MRIGFGERVTPALLCLLLLSAPPVQAQTDSTARTAVSDIDSLSSRSTPDLKVIRNRHRRLSELPDHMRLTGGTDQRYFLLNDIRNSGRGPKIVGISGVRGGFMFPSGFKAGAGLYLTNQRFTRRDLFKESYSIGLRRLRYGLVYYEPFAYRKRLWELSIPLEVGWGISTYELSQELTGQQIRKKGTFVPAGVGLSFLFRCPPIRKLRALRWLGAGALVGYRFVLKPDFPGSPVNYNGFYFSAGPTFFLDRAWEDYKDWRRQRRKDRIGKDQ